MCAAGYQNQSDNDNNNHTNNKIIFTIKNAKVYVPVITLSTRGNQKLSKLLSKGFERSVYWNEYETKCEDKNTTRAFRFLDSNFV